MCLWLENGNKQLAAQFSSLWDFPGFASVLQPPSQEFLQISPTQLQKLSRLVRAIGVLLDCVSLVTPRINGGENKNVSCFEPPLGKRFIFLRGGVVNEVNYY